MNKPFTFILPDEPYKTTTLKNNTVNCIYTGNRFLTLDVTLEDGTINGVVDKTDIKPVVPKECRIPGHAFIVVDALDNLVGAASVTGDYTNEDVPDFEEDVPGGKYTFTYSKGTGVIGLVITFPGIKFDHETNKISASFPYRIHANTRETTLNGFLSFANTIDKYLSKFPEYFSEEETTKLKKHSDWLKTIPTVYANVDHWKIPFPVNVPSLPPGLPLPED